MVLFLFSLLTLPHPLFLRWSAAFLLVVLAYANICTPTKTEPLLEPYPDIPAPIPIDLFRQIR